MTTEGLASLKDLRVPCVVSWDRWDDCSTAETATNVFAHGSTDDAAVQALARKLEKDAAQVLDNGGAEALSAWRTSLCDEAKVATIDINAGNIRPPWMCAEGAETKFAVLFPT